MKRRNIIKLAVPGNEPPSEFCIFTAGTVETTKGTFTFGPAEAAAVMAEYQAHGIDLAIDYDHAMLGGGGDPAQTGKAAAWFNLEVRGGELWAVNVRWTESAAEALRAKEWRFMSPAFTTKDGRITSLLNVAITNLPATRRLEPLMAANATGGTGMSIDEFLKVCKVLGIDTSSPIADALARIKGGDPDADTEDAAPPAGDGGADEEAEVAASRREALAAAAAPDAATKKKIGQIAKIVDADPTIPEAVLEGVKALLGLTDAAPTGGDAAATSTLFRLTSTNTLGAAAAEVKALKRALQASTAELAEFDKAERVALCRRLVVDGGRFPAHVWNPFIPGEPKPYLQSMPLAELKQHVEEEVRVHRGSGGNRRVVSGSFQPPVESGGADEWGNSAREVAMCTELKVDPKDYAQRKALRSGKAQVTE